jgi:hypothetical protein
MMKYKSLLAGAALAATLASSGYAGQVDWSVSYNGTVDQSQVGGSDTSHPLYQNVYGWDRSVSAWQSFQAGTSGLLGGIGMDLSYAQANGAVDLNIYSGTGVQGTLLESTHLQWNNSFSSGEAQWHTFQLDSPVALTAGSQYTFSFENLGADMQLRYIDNTSANAYPAGEYMQQGYFGGDGYGMEYSTGTTAADMNFQTTMVAVPEPSTAATVLLGLGFLAMAWYRKAAVARG